jgi:hypothetical protein
MDEVVAQKLIKKYDRMPVYPVGSGKVKLAAGWLRQQD